jgi:hypothetical protein
LTDSNLFTYILYGLFLMPLIIGLITPFSRERIEASLISFIDNIGLICAMILSVYLTKQIFFNEASAFFRQIYNAVPNIIKEILQGKDVLVYIISVPFILVFMLLFLRIVSIPVYKAAKGYFPNKIYLGVAKMGTIRKRLLSALWQLPKSVYLTLIFVLALNFFSYYFYAPSLTRWMNESRTYQLIYDKALLPVLNSNIAKDIPVILNNSFAKDLDRAVPENGEFLIRRIGERITKGLDIQVIEYFNGVTLDEAVRSHEKIDRLAKEIISDKKKDREKEFALYEWISANIEYDFQKAETVSRGVEKVPSGAITAFSEKKGICLDYSALYIAMCRATGLKSRLITGLAYSGTGWGDHAWNQVFISEEQIWVNVDTTFGNIANYFDKSDFEVDHKYAEIQGEWQP